jgi:hypothetical protein
MSDFFSSLTPQAAILLGVTWLTREIFGFISKMFKEIKDVKMNNTKDAGNVEVLLLKQISAKLDTNNKAINELNVNLSLFTQKITKEIVETS